MAIDHVVQVLQLRKNPFAFSLEFNPLFFSGNICSVESFTQTHKLCVDFMLGYLHDLVIFFCYVCADQKTNRYHQARQWWMHWRSNGRCWRTYWGLVLDWLRRTIWFWNTNERNRIMERNLWKLLDWFIKIHGKITPFFPLFVPSSLISAAS